MHHETEREWFERQCAQARSFGELAEIGVSELKKFPEGCGLVSGPITTGGLGSRERNSEVFHAVIYTLREDGHQVFDQMPYETAILRLRDEWFEEDSTRRGQYCMPVLEEFYGPLIDAGVFKTNWHIPGSRTSTGAVWEREKFQRRSEVEIVDLKETFIVNALAAYRGGFSFAVEC